jgi:tRNA nucleotidyltransferase/poly(A) polymerase
MQDDSWSQGLKPDALAAAREVARVLSQAGHRAWLVGGCVRDLVLGRSPHDLDLVSKATPDEVQGLFPRTVAVGKAFGVMRVLQGRFDFELATFRSDGAYVDGRHPTEVQLDSSAELDAARRDFTCNALYLDPLDGTRLDPTNGMQDLEAGILRAVGDAQKRFEEDSLRLMRMARFEANLGLQPAPGLHAAALAVAPGLQRVSPERVLDELVKVCSGPNPARAMEILVECSLLGPALPQLPAGGEELRVRTIAALQMLDSVTPLILLAAFLDPGDQGQAGLLDSLPLAREQRRSLVGIWQARALAVQLGAEDNMDPADLARALRGVNGAGGLTLARARCQALDADPAPLERLFEWTKGATLEVETLLNGEELAQLGVERGPLMGTILYELEGEQLRGRVSTPDEARAFVHRRLQG